MNKVDLLIMGGIVIALGLVISYRFDALTQQNDEIIALHEDILKVGLNLTKVYGETIAIGNFVALHDYIMAERFGISPVVDSPEWNGHEDKTSALVLLAQQNTSDQKQNLSTDIGELQTEVIKLRNQLQPRNISEAFPLYPTSSIDAPNNTYSEMKEGSIAGFGSASNNRTS